MRTKTCSAFFLTALLLVTPTVAAAQAPSCPGADGYADTTSQEQAQTAVTCLANVARGRAGVGPLANVPELVLAATRHSQDMDDRNFFSHDAKLPAPYGVDFTERLVAAGYTGSPRGENIGSGYGTARDVVEGWLQSDGHCRSMLSASSDQTGAGRSRTGDLWTQVFGATAVPASYETNPACTSPPSLDDVLDPDAVVEPPDDVKPRGKAGLRRATGAEIARVTRSRTRWTLTMRAGHADGRTMTMSVRAGRRTCTSRRSCRIVATGPSLSRRRVTLGTGTRLVVPRVRATRVVTVRVSAFSTSGERYAATTIRRTLKP